MMIKPIQVQKKLSFKKWRKNFKIKKQPCPNQNQMNFRVLRRALLLGLIHWEKTKKFLNKSVRNSETMFFI